MSALPQTNTHTHTHLPTRATGPMLAAIVRGANAKQLVGHVTAHIALTEDTRAQLESYFLPHTQRLLRRVLPELSTRGMRVFGFQGEPWTSKL